MTEENIPDCAFLQTLSPLMLTCQPLHTLQPLRTAAFCHRIKPSFLLAWVLSRVRIHRRYRGVAISHARCWVSCAVHRVLLVKKQDFLLGVQTAWKERAFGRV